MTFVCPIADAPELPCALRMPLRLAAALQDDLLAVSTDLERLQRLLAGACEALSRHLFAAVAAVDAAALPAASQAALTGAFDGAVTALQFQDLASQSIAHCAARLAACADRIAAEALPDDADGQALAALPPPRANPVTRDEHDAGSIELF